MNYFRLMRFKVLEILNTLEEAELLPKGSEKFGVAVEFPRDPKHGDLSTNVAMVLAKAVEMKPRELADLIVVTRRKRNTRSGPWLHKY